MANVAESTHQTNRALALLDRLRSQLKGFAVFDKNKALVGEVRDLNLHPQNRFNLIISQPDPHKGNRLFLVNSKWVERVHSAEQAVYLNLTEDEITHLPDYTMPSTFNPDSFDLPSDAPHSSNVNAAVNASTVNAGLNDAPMSSVSSGVAPSANRSASVPTASNTTPDPQAIVEQAAATSQATSALTPSDEAVIRLVEEKLQVNRDKRKVGEVIIRKEIETTMVQVPVHREKLIVEQLSPERKELARVDLQQGEINGIELTQSGMTSDGKPVVRGEFNSPRAASQMLAEMAKILHHRCSAVRVELVLQDPQLRETYQNWVTHYGGELR